MDTQVVQQQPTIGFYGCYVRPVFSWFWVLTMRFFKGIRDGILFTPLIELLFIGLRKMRKVK